MNPWHDARLLNALANLLFGLTLLAVLGGAAWWLSQRPYFTLRTIEVHARAGTELRYVSADVLRTVIEREVRGNFFAADLEQIRGVFETVPWVRRAGVRRVWPAGLLVDIEEHRPLAVWGDGRLVNTFGELFPANLGEAEEHGPLPKLAGPPGSAPQVVQRYAELRRVVAALGLEPVALELSGRHAWTMRLDDDTTLLLGRDRGTPVGQRLARWVQTYPQVKALLDRRAELIDLRYPNGFAIRSLAMLDGAPADEGEVRRGQWR